MQIWDKKKVDLKMELNQNFAQAVTYTVIACYKNCEYIQKVIFIILPNSCCCPRGLSQ